MSYRKKHVKSKINRIKPKKSIFARFWFWITILLLVIVLLVTYFVLFYPGFQLENIIISGNNKIKDNDLRSAVFEFAQREMISLGSFKIYSSSIFLINKSEISSNIQERFPEIERITMSKNLPKTVVLSVIERRPLGAFCDSTEKCYLIDGSGVVFEPLSSIPEDITIVRQAFGNKEASSGKIVLAQHVIGAISKIQKDLADNFQIGVKTMLIVSSNRLNVETDENWRIYFDLGTSVDFDLQLTKLDLLLSGELSTGQEGSSRTNLRYIDLRPNDRAIVCDNATCGG